MLLQIPGGVELLVVLLIAVIVFGIPLLLIAVVGGLYLRADSGDDGDEDVAERVAELETEIEQLRSEIGDESPPDRGTDDRPVDDERADG